MESQKQDEKETTPKQENQEEEKKSIVENTEDTSKRPEPSQEEDKAEEVDIYEGLSKKEKQLMQRARMVSQTENILTHYGARLDPAKKKTLGNQIKLAQPHQFWDDQPVWKMFDEAPKNDGPIINQQLKDISTEEIPLPNGFEWVNVDITDPDAMQKLYELLRDHYVEDDDN